MPRDVEGDLESLVVQLSEGTAEERGQAAEKLFNTAADDEYARQNAAAFGVIPPLVCVQPFGTVLTWSVAVHHYLGQLNLVVNPVYTEVCMTCKPSRQVFACCVSSPEEIC